MRDFLQKRPGNKAGQHEKRANQRKMGRILLRLRPLYAASILTARQDRPGFETRVQRELRFGLRWDFGGD
jgi:hypothetical protein